MKKHYIETKAFKNVVSKATENGVVIKEIGWEREVYKCTDNGTIFSSGNDKTVLGNKRNYIVIAKGEYSEKILIYFDEDKPKQIIKAVDEALNEFLKGIMQ